MLTIRKLAKAGARSPGTVDGSTEGTVVVVLVVGAGAGAGVETGAAAIGATLGIVVVGLELEVGVVVVVGATVVVVVELDGNRMKSMVTYRMPSLVTKVPTPTCV